MRTIDADKLKDTVEAQKDDFPCEKEDEFWNMTIDSIIKIIDNAPTVDTTFKEVVAYECGQKSVKRPHSEWIKGPEIFRTMLGNTVKYIEYKDYTCSNCGLVLDNLLYHVDGSPFYKFCPNCGADMREEKKDDN